MSIGFWILLIAGLVLIIKWLVDRNRDDVSSGESAMDILKTRYAKGEIDRQTFERIKKDID